jgi:hypothetical protein
MMTMDRHGEGGDRTSDRAADWRGGESQTRPDERGEDAGWAPAGAAGAPEATQIAEQDAEQETRTRADSGTETGSGAPADEASRVASTATSERIDPAAKASRLPDDRYDGTDSGPGGTDLPYPAGPAADAPDTEPPASSKAGQPAGELGPQRDRPDGGDGPGAEASTGTDYATDGPDDLGVTPQR